MPQGDGQIPPSEGPPPPPPDSPESGPSPSGRVRSGSFTALLQQIAAVDDDDFGAGWFKALSPRAVVGRFEMVRELGRGGFGVVWEARDQKLGRNIAFKAVRAGGRAKLREERLMREAEAAARLSHPNIVTIHDVGQAEQGPYLVLEGETLEQRLERGPLPVREAVHVAAEIAKGVAHAHARGIVHRDLKPANVILCHDGRVKVLDFGMAQAFGQRRDEGGTPAYMAPEQWAGAPEDERSDVYALGAMLFEMATGELPFVANDGGKAVRSPTRAPALEVAEAPALGELVARMLEKNPTDRPRECGEVLEVLTEIEATLAALSATPVAKVRRRRRTSWLVLAGLAAGVFLGGTMTAYALLRRPPGSPDADGRALVAVADFANETHDPDLDGLSGLLITSLEQSKNFRVLTRGRMIDLVRELGQGSAPRIDESVARAVGKKAGVNTLLLASIQKLGDTYAAELRALDPKRDEYLFTVREQAERKSELLPLIDRMSERTRLALREPEAQVRGSEVKVGEAVTGNLEAYRHYFRGKELAAKTSYREAIDEYRHALELEPGFTLAAAELAFAGYRSGGIPRPSARDLLRKAAEGAAKAPAKEAGLMRALTAFYDARFAAAADELRALAARFPDDRDVAVTGADLVNFCGRLEDALLLYERARRLAPDSDAMLLNQVQLLADLGKPDDARRIAEEAVRVHPTPSTRVAAGLARYYQGDAEGGVAALRSSGADGYHAKAILAEGLASIGRFEDAFATAATIDGPWGDTTRAQILAYAGRLREGLGTLDSAARRPGVDASFAHQRIARYLAAAGFSARAREEATRGDIFTYLDAPMLTSIGDEKRLAELVAHVGPGDHFVARVLRAHAAYQRGDRKAALSAFRALDVGTVSFVPYFHGMLAADAGLDAEAVDALRRFQRPVFSGSEGNEAPWMLARARLVEARSLDRLGRRDEARRILALQLARWKDADPDLPLLAELKALDAALQRAPAQ